MAIGSKEVEIRPSMDVPRKSRAGIRRFRRIGMGAAILAVLGAVTVGLSRLDSASPAVDADLLWIGTVERGEFVRSVRGSGVLVPKDVWWIPAPAEGRVEVLHALPGEAVDPDTPILTLSNPALEQEVWSARFDLAMAESELMNQTAQLDTERLDREDTLIMVESELEVAVKKMERDAELFSAGLLSGAQLEISKAKVRELESRAQLAARQLTKLDEAREAKLSVQQSQVAQFKSLLAMREKKMNDMVVRSPEAGVVQQVLVEVGQQVTPTTSLAKVARPNTLKAELRVAETQAKDLVVGQKVTIDTRNGFIDGRLARIDPTVLDGSVTVDVELEGELPRGARPDLSVEGNIEIERLDDTLFVDRPVAARAQGQVELFKLDALQKTATRVKVRLGKSSVNTVQVIEGLQQGDRVILSDMSRWDHVDRVRLR